MLKKTLIFATFSIGALIGVLSLQTAFGGEEMTDYSLNDSGETYGSALYSTSSADEPDLIQAIGVDGTEGYIKKVDLDRVTGESDLPKTPEEALAKQAERERNQDTDIPLYEANGKTVIGVFSISLNTE
ncbi:peptidase M56 BlaR1 [Alkalihalobacillus sp. NPDC078783]